jgi:hypothetical protein
MGAPPPASQAILFGGGEYSVTADVSSSAIHAVLEDQGGQLLGTLDWRSGDSRAYLQLGDRSFGLDWPEASASRQLVANVLYDTWRKVSKVASPSVPYDDEPPVDVSGCRCKCLYCDCPSHDPFASGCWCCEMSCWDGNGNPC